MIECQDCQGKGFYEVNDEEGNIEAKPSRNIRCEICHGTGKI